MTSTALKVVSAHTPALESVTGTVVTLRAHDRPNISARGFLEAIMHSSHLSLALRVDAANKLLKLEPPPITNIINDEGPVIKYIIPSIPST